MAKKAKKAKNEVERSGITWLPDKATTEAPTASSIDVVMAACRKKYGEGIVMLASDAPAAEVRRLSSGILGVDAAIGGGWPRGRTNMIFGKESSGKSSLALKAAGMAHRTCRLCGEVAFPRLKPFLVDKETGEQEALSEKQHKKLVEKLPEGKSVIEFEDPDDLECRCGSFVPWNVVWLDVERSYMKSWASNMGVRNELVHLVWPEFAEAAMDIIDALLRTGELDLLVVDSIAQMTPKKEIEASFSDELVAVMARKMNRLLRKIGSAQCAQGGLQNENAPTVLMINQLRDSVSAYGPREVRPGGRGQYFASSVELKLRQGQWRKHVRDGVSHSPAMETIFVANKNRCSAPKREGVYTMWLEPWKDGKVDRHPGDVEETESVLDVLRQFKALPDEPPYNIDGRTFEDEASFVDAAHNDSRFFWQLRQLALGVLI